VSKLFGNIFLKFLKRFCIWNLCCIILMFI